MSVVQFEIFPVDRPRPEQIVERALAYKPVAIFALFSGGNGSLASTAWCMQNIPGCEVLHIVTGIGVRRTENYVVDTCAQQGWPLTVKRAKEDCGQDYDAIVAEHGFPGPAGHQFMYARLKERCIELVVRERKTKRSDKVMLCTGIVHDDSQRRSGYGGREVNFKGAQMWVNPLYWMGGSWLYHYVNEVGISRNPVAAELGMSGECLCGSFASPGELEIVRRVCPSTAERIDRLQEVARANGHCWGWEERPPAKPIDTMTPDLFSPMCVNCLKSERLAA